ncbi:MAG TPA: polyhydroxyalkanoate synthesis repressor PhaR [Rhodocyclaceae bacterium]|nr:polyhydroxyalkanoate synthesis repressor PhaR [Rhodocyclaceae bacterium]
MGDSSRVIKKYPNRRLYDTQTSSYITLSDVKELVMAYEEFKVVDAKTGDDLTRSILMQIILEEESGGVPMFSPELLSHMIRFYGNPMQAMLGKYLENNIRGFVDFNKQMQEQSRSVGGDTIPMQKEMWAQFLNFQGPAMQTMMSAYMDQSSKMVQQMQAQMESQARNMFTGFQFPDKKPK